MKHAQKWVRDMGVTIFIGNGSTEKVLGRALLDESPPPRHPRSPVRSPVIL